MTLTARASGLPSAAALRGVFDGFTHRGYTTRVDVQRDQPGVDPMIGPHHGLLTASVDIRHNRALVGQIGSRVYIAPTGQLVAMHAPAYMDDRHHAAGFGSTFVAHVDNGLKRLGVERVDVWPSRVASYVAARAGYQLDSPETIRDVIEQAADRLRAAQLPDTMREGVRRLLTATRAGRVKTLQQLADFGRDEPHKLAITVDRFGVAAGGPSVAWWPGKLVLVASEWQGHKVLAS